MKKLLANYLYFQVNDSFRKRLNKYTRKAFQFLPQFENPKIIDIGCGTGVPTLELAKLSSGEILGIDINQFALNLFNRKIREKGLSDRVKTKLCSMFEMDFPDQSYDIIWSEGSIYKIGFLNGIKNWKRFLKVNGFLVVHDRIEGKQNDLKKVSTYGYEIVNKFELPKDVWWKEYFEPLEKELKKICLPLTDPEFIQEFEKIQGEIDFLKNNPTDCLSGFYIMQKNH